MVAEFDKVVFSAPINEVQGPVKVRQTLRSDSVHAASRLRCTLSNRNGTV
jgi:hypothetical protein